MKASVYHEMMIKLRLIAIGIVFLAFCWISIRSEAYVDLIEPIGGIYLEIQARERSEASSVKVDGCAVPDFCSNYDRDDRDCGSDTGSGRD